MCGLYIYSASLPMSDVDESLPHCLLACMQGMKSRMKELSSNLGLPAGASLGL